MSFIVVLSQTSCLFWVHYFCVVAFRCLKIWCCSRNSTEHQERKQNNAWTRGKADSRCHWAFIVGGNLTGLSHILIQFIILQCPLYYVSTRFSWVLCEKTSCFPECRSMITCLSRMLRMAAFTSNQRFIELKNV